MTSASVRVLLVCLVLVSGFKTDLEREEAALVSCRAPSEKAQVPGKLAHHVSPYILRRVIAAVLLGALYLRVYREKGSWVSFRDAPLRFMGAPSVELWLKKQTQKFQLGSKNLKLQLDLVTACSANNVALVKELIKKGAKPEIDLWTTASPFKAAVDGGYLEVVRALVKDGGLKVTSSHLSYAKEKSEEIEAHLAYDFRFPDNCRWSDSKLRCTSIPRKNEYFFLNDSGENEDVKVSQSSAIKLALPEEVDFVDYDYSAPVQNISGPSSASLLPQLLFSVLLYLQYSLINKALPAA